MEKKERNTGIELLRILALLFIVQLHVLKQGGVLAAANDIPSMAKTAWLMEILALGCVDVFALISGYVGCTSKFRPSRVIKIWALALFYSLGISFAGWLIWPESMNMSKWVQAFFPITTGRWWYVSCYIGLLFLLPVINKGLQETDIRLLRISAVGLLALMSLLPAVLRFYPFNQEYTDPYGTNQGYSVLWLLALYVFGAYSARKEAEKDCSGATKNTLWKKGKYLLSFLLSVFLTWVSLFFLQDYTLWRFGEVRYTDILLGYTSPLVLVAALSLLKLFAGTEVRSERARKVICTISGCVLGAYVIHTHPLVWGLWIKDMGMGFVTGTPIMMVLKVLGAVFTVSVLCIVVELLRRLLFRYTGLNKAIAKTDEQRKDESYLRE